MLATAVMASADVYYVRQGGTGDGSTWENATGNLQTAINHAQAGDEVWVAGGTYRPDSLIRGNKPTSRTFFLKDGVSLYGGFSGVESSKEERARGDRPYEWQNVTVLDANDDVPDVWERAIAEGTSYRYGWKYDNEQLEVQGTHGNGTHVLYCAENIQHPTEINGFTLTGANANVWQTKAWGGALYAMGNVQLRACVIKENSAYFSAESTTDSNTYGGAVFLYSEGEGVIEDCLFRRNYAHSSYGSGLGGAVYARKCVVRNCEFVDCVADDGGALYNNGGTVENCSFDACYASAGGALFNNGTAHDIQVFSCRGLLGGGIYNNYGQLTNVIVANCYADAPEYGPTMGGRGGGILLNDGNVINAAVFNNMAFWGGGIYIAGIGGVHNATVQRNMIRANAEADTANIGMEPTEVDIMRVINCIYLEADGSNFECPTQWRGVAVDQADSLAIHNASWQLMAGSEFIDAGSGRISGVDTDLAGNARIVGDAIDLGAYEYQGQVEPLRGDVNNDKRIDISDVNILINIMLGNDNADNYEGRAYVTEGDTQVDIADINAVINMMLGK